MSSRLTRFREQLAEQRTDEEECALAVMESALVRLLAEPVSVEERRKDARRFCRAIGSLIRSASKQGTA